MFTRRIIKISDFNEFSRKFISLQQGISNSLFLSLIFQFPLGGKAFKKKKKKKSASQLVNISWEAYFCRERESERERLQQQKVKLEFSGCADGG